MADYLEGAGRNIHGKRLADLLRSDRTVLRREPAGVMEGYGGAKTPYSPTFSPGENPEITLGDIAETAWDVVSPLGLYAGDVEAAKGKGAKGGFPAVRKAIAKLRGKEFEPLMDQTGKPLTVYHGTKGDVRDLRPSTGGEYGGGIYASPDEGAAWKYAGWAPGEGGQNIMPLHMSMKNPYIATSRDEVRALGVKKLKAQGYDGIIATSPTGERQYIAFDPEQVRSKFDPGVAEQKVAKLRGKETAEYKVTPETPPSILRALREVEAPRETGLGKRFKEGEKAGVHRGTEAFGGIKNVGPMRAAYLRKMEEGAPHRLWYDETSEDILRIAGGDPDKADKLANMLGITSQSTQMPGNTMFGFKGWNQQAVGDPLKTGQYPTRMASEILRTQDSPEAAATGLKRSPFTAGLSVAWRPPTSAQGIRPTHDIHDIRAWGITDPNTDKPWMKGMGEAGHRFLDEQAAAVTKAAQEQKLGGFEDWNPYRAQAAAWVSQKGKDVGIDEARKHYGDFIPDYSAQVTREWVPGENTGHLQELLRAPEATRRAYSDEMEQLFRGPQGIDALANEMGLLSDVTLPNRGVYEGATNPGYASQIPVGKATGEHAIDPSSATALNALASAHGMFGTQKQSAWNFAAGKSPISKANLLRINRGSPYSEAELAQLHEAVPGMDVPMVDPQGARVLEFGDKQAELIKALRGAAPEAQIEPQAFSGNLIPESPGEKFSYLPYIEGVEAGGPKMVEGFDRAAQTRAPQVLARTEAWAEREGWAQAPFFKDAMQILATKGLAGLKEAQRAGIVPAAFVTGIEGLGQEDGR